MTYNSIAAVIPLHNKKNFVARALTSVLAQNTPVDEVIIVDDASTDGSLDEIRPFLGNPKLRVLRREEPGPGGYAARNLGIQSAKARWIAFLDADDTWNDDFIEEISKLIECASDATGCVFTGYEKVWSPGRVSRDKYSLRHERAGFKTLDFDRFLSEWIEIGNAPIWTSACAIRRDVLLAAGLFPENRCRLGGDKDMWLRAMAHTNALSSPRSCASYHTVTENQVTRTESINSRPCLVSTVEDMLATATSARRVLLMRLFNREVFEYALNVPPGQRVSPEIYRGFDISLNPLRYGLLLALTYLPTVPKDLLRFVILRTRALARKAARLGSVLITVAHWE
jgi:hypothetical protein